jgi:hypothetical protein
MRIIEDDVRTGIVHIRMALGRIDGVNIAGLEREARSDNIELLGG